MRAWLLDRMGDGIDKVHLGEVPDPSPGAGEALIDLTFAGLNPADRYLAENMYPAKPQAFPHILGRDGIGTIRALGPDVTDFKNGQKVNIIHGQAGINLPGTFAERIVANVETLGTLPAGWTDEQAAAAPLVYETAYQAITQWDDLPALSVVLITGASGGVGSAAVQLAKAMGHTVIGLSRDAEKSTKLREIGADMAFDPNDPNWKKLAKEQLGKRRVNLAIDNVGGKPFNDVLDMMAMNGRITVVGRLAGAVPEFNTASLFFRRLRIGGIAIHSYEPAETRHAWEQAQRLLKQSGARPLVDSIHPFDQLHDAFKRLERGPLGKVLLRIP
ncbi:MAG: zinc-binding alcohol dehydrogenase family protein [Anaerolineae bacterium]|nr:zinc-binding alcohol dehydrogenase family protein [Phycisphaerae bacterium]